MIDEDDIPLNLFVFQKLLKAKKLYIQPFYVNDDRAKEIGGTNYQVTSIDIEERDGDPPFKVVITFSVDHGTGKEAVIYLPAVFRNIELIKRNDRTWLIKDQFGATDFDAEAEVS
jgi:hypothetical protein